MSRTPVAATPRPTLVDYFLLFAGAGLSAYLMTIAPIFGKPHDNASQFVHEVVQHVLPGAMRVTEGIVLMWPILYGLQRLRGRFETLTAAEWLWVIDWVGVALLTALAVWVHYGPGSLPDFLKDHANKPRLLWYFIFVPSLAGLALVFYLFSMVSRKPLPWTHACSIALMIWPALPVAAVYTLGKGLTTSALPSLPPM